MFAGAKKGIVLKWRGPNYEDLKRFMGFKRSNNYFLFLFQVKRDGENVFEAFIYAPLFTLMLMATFVLGGFALVTVLQFGIAMKESIKTFWNWLTR